MSLGGKNANKTAAATIKIPFDTKQHAEIAYRVLSVDEEPRRNFVSKNLLLDEDCIEVRFTANELKNLRAAISSFFENLFLCKDTIQVFDVTSTKNATAVAGTDAS